MGKIKSLMYTFFGILMVSFAISTCYLPNKIVNGGVSGISTILYHTLHVAPGLTNVVINVFLLLLGLKFLGKGFILKTLASTVVLSVFVQVFTYFPPLTKNVLLATVFGAVLYGFGIGLTLVAGASSGGTDILARLIQHKFSHLPIGKILLAVDGCIIFSSLVIFKKIDITLYGIVALVVSTYAIDFLIRSLNISKLAFIITEKGEDISNKLIKTSPRGVTIIDAVGAYSGEKKKMLVCAMKQNEISSFQKKILNIDPDAFIIFSESQQIVGNGFCVYK